MTESLEFYEVTEGMTPNEIGGALISQNKLSMPIARKLEFDKPLRIAVLGASIMNAAFGDSGRVNEFISDLESAGVSVLDFKEYAVGGHKTSDTLSLLPGFIADYAGYEDQTIVILHIGGNNISANGPYPGGKDTLDSEYRQILSDLKTAGFTVFPSSITYRVPPGSNPSAPYNQMVVIPAITELADHALKLSGRPIIDLYELTMTEEGMHSPDGVHYTSSGSDGITKYIGQQLSKCVGTINATAQYIGDIIVDFGGAYETVDFSNFASGSHEEKTLSAIFDSDGKKIEDLSVTINGFANAANSSGVDYGGSGYSLDRPEITRDSLFVSHPSFGGYVADTGTIQFSGNSIEDSAMYEVTIVASRDASGDGLRWGTYRIDGETQDLNADGPATGSANRITFSVNGAVLKNNPLTVQRRSEDVGINSFAYVSGIRIRKL